MAGYTDQGRGCACNPQCRVHQCTCDPPCDSWADGWTACRDDPDRPQSLVEWLRNEDHSALIGGDVEAAKAAIPANHVEVVAIGDPVYLRKTPFRRRAIILTAADGTVAFVGDADAAKEVSEAVAAGGDVPTTQAAGTDGGAESYCALI